MATVTLTRFEEDILSVHELQSGKYYVSDRSCGSLGRHCLAIMQTIGMGLFFLESGQWSVLTSVSVQGATFREIRSGETITIKV